MKKVLSLLVLFLATGVLIAQNPQVEELMKSGRTLVNKNDALALKKFEAVLEIDDSNFEALHQASLMSSRVGNRLSDEASQTKYFRSAKDLAQRAITVNPSNAEGYYVMGVALGRISLIAGTKEKVSNVRAIKENAETALRYDNKHGGAWHLLGRVNVGVANASTAERIAANTFFGGLPKEMSNEKAINCYKNALKYKPNTILFMYDLAGALFYNKQHEESQMVLKQLLKTPNGTEDDTKTKKEAEEMLAEF